MEPADPRLGAFRIGRVARPFDLAERAPPILPQGLHDHGLDHPLDMDARCVVGAEPATFVHVERAFQQGAEEGRLDVRPRPGRGPVKRDEASLDSG